MIGIHVTFDILVSMFDDVWLSACAMTSVLYKLRLEMFVASEFESLEIHVYKRFSVCVVSCLRTPLLGFSGLP